MDNLKLTVVPRVAGVDQFGRRLCRTLHRCRPWLLPERGFAGGACNYIKSGENTKQKDTTYLKCSARVYD